MSDLEKIIGKTCGFPPRTLRNIGNIFLPEVLIDTACRSVASQVTNRFVTGFSSLPDREKTQGGLVKYVTKLFAQFLSDTASQLMMDALFCK